MDVCVLTGAEGGATGLAVERILFKFHTAGERQRDPGRRERGSRVEGATT